MDASVYAVVAYIARYWFALLAVLIIWRAIRWLRQDIDRTARAQRFLPDAGYIGEWAVVASDARNMPEGQILRAPRDGWIGSARACDVRVTHAGAPARAARFYLREDGLHLLPQRRDSIVVDGEPVQREAVLRHGATLTVGGVTLQLRLFAGVLLSGEMPVRGHKRQRPMPVYEEPDEEEAEIPYDQEIEQDILEEEEAYEYDEIDDAPPPQDEAHAPFIQPALKVRRRPRRRG